MSYIDFCNKYSSYFKMPVGNKESSDNHLLKTYRCISELNNIQYAGNSDDMGYYQDSYIYATKENIEKYEKYNSSSSEIGSSDFNGYGVKATVINGKQENVIVQYPNNLKTVFEKIYERIMALSKAITDAFNNLYTDYDQEYYTETMEGMNFSLMNGYAETSKSYEKYDPNTLEFSRMPDYWYIRGHYYELIPKGMEGKYIEEKFKIPNPSEYGGYENFCDYIVFLFFEPYEQDFLEYREIEYQRWLDACMNAEPDPETGETKYPPEPDYADDYWMTTYGLTAKEVCYGRGGTGISKLTYVDNLINSFLNPVWIIIDDFKEFKNQQKFYFSVFNAYQNLMGKVNIFMNNEKKSSSSTDYNLFDTYNTNFKYEVYQTYCPTLQDVYDLFLTGKNQTEIYMKQKGSSFDSSEYNTQKALNIVKSYGGDSFDFEATEKNNIQSKITNYYILSKNLLTYGGKSYNYWTAGPLLLNWIGDFRKKYSLTTIEES